MSELYPHPTDEQIWRSPYKNSSRPRAAYLKAYQEQCRSAKLATERAANTVETDRSPSRFAPPDDPRIVSEHKRLRAVHRGFTETEPPKIQIPMLDAKSEADAKDAYFWFVSKFRHGGDDSAYRAMGLLKFARALHLIPSNAGFTNADDPIRLLTLKLIRSKDAFERFSEKGWTA